MDWKMLLVTIVHGVTATPLIWFLQLPSLSRRHSSSPGWPADCPVLSTLVDLWDVCFLTHPGRSRCYLADVGGETCSGKQAHCRFCPLRSFPSAAPASEASRWARSVGVWENKFRSAWTGMQVGIASPGEQSGSVWVGLYLIPFQMQKSYPSTEQRTPDTLHADLPLI